MRIVVRLGLKATICTGSSRNRSVQRYTLGGSMIILIFLLLGIIIFCAPRYFRNIFKVSYYETTFMNNKHLFSEDRFKGIERVIKDNWLFVKRI